MTSEPGPGAMMTLGPGFLGGLDFGLFDFRAGSVPSESGGAISGVPLPASKPVFFVPFTSGDSGVCFSLITKNKRENHLRNWVK